MNVRVVLVIKNLRHFLRKLPKIINGASNDFCNRLFRQISGPKTFELSYWSLGRSHFTFVTCIIYAHVCPTAFENSRVYLYTDTRVLILCCATVLPLRCAMLGNAKQRYQETRQRPDAKLF